MWLLRRACEVQTTALAKGRLPPVATPVLEGCVRGSLNFKPRFGAGRDALDTQQRLVDRGDRSHRS